MGQLESESGETAEDGLEVWLRKEVLRNEGIQIGIFHRETVEAEVNDPGFDYLGPFFTEGLDLYVNCYVFQITRL